MLNWRNREQWLLATVDGYDVVPYRTVPVWGWRGPSRPTDGSGYDMHYPLEFGIVLSGIMRRHYRAGPIDLDAGQVWFCGAWERHGWDFVERPCDFVVLHILPTALMNASIDGGEQVNWMAPFRAPMESRPQSTPETKERIIALGRRLADRVSDEEDPCQSTWLLLLVLETLLTLQEDWVAPIAENPPSAAASAVVNEAMELVFSSPGFVTAQVVASACGMSRSAFGKIFQRLTGISFAKFALRYRLSRAAAQLLRTNDPVKSIAHHWGFTDVSHLNRCFQRHYGCSPATYRKRYA